MTRARSYLLAAAIGFAAGAGLSAFQGWEKPWTGADDWLTLLGSGLSGAVVAAIGLMILSRAQRRGG